MTVPFLDVGAGYEELQDELDAAYRRVTGSGSYILGEEVDAFEREFAEYCGVEHCVGVANGLEALFLILLGYGVGPGDEVIVPANTYIATWLAASHSGATPVPVEPDSLTWTLDPAEIEAAITERTRAIMPVHLYGRTADVGAIVEVARRHELKVVVDAAQAHGATCDGARPDALGDAAGFSFYPAKNLGALGDAGAITTADGDLAERLRLLRNYGAPSKYQNDVIGYNSRLDPLQAAFLRAKLDHLDAWNSRRAELAARYGERLAGVSGLTLPAKAEGSGSVWHVFVIRHPERDRLRDFLGARGIETLIHYPIPPHLSPAYSDLAVERAALPITESLADTVLSLPIGPHLSMSDCDRVIDAVRAFR